MENPSREVTQAAVDAELRQMADAKLESGRITQLMEVGLESVRDSAMWAGALMQRQAQWW